MIFASNGLGPKWPNFQQFPRIAPTSRYSLIFKAPDNTVVKTGPLVCESEAVTMHLLKLRTSIPVPKVLETWTDAQTGHYCIRMEFIKGRLLEELYDSDEVDDGDALLLGSQLQGYLTELRQFRSDVIAAVGEMPCRDVFLPRNPLGSTYSDEAGFRGALNDFLWSRRQTVWAKTVIGFINDMAEPPESFSQKPFVMTHGELTPRNIKVARGGIVGILDWSQAGYYPVYWEYTKAHLFYNTQSGYYGDGIPNQMLPQRYSEHASVMKHAYDIIY
ncbi:kinase-like domain-containing protein [Xylariales sp. AK1849]|nr:kinase-like domain-containing protein [Xylariales sp. AK1849]